MIDIKKLTPGQKLWDIKRNTGIDAFRSKWSHWPVVIQEVNIEEGWVIASWNGNRPEKRRARNGKFPWFKEQKQ